MPGNLKSLFLPEKIRKRIAKHFAIWRFQNSSSAESGLQSKAPFENSISSSEFENLHLALQGSSAIPSQSSTLNQNGFAYVFLISLLPIILAAGLFSAFSLFLQRNWMQSLHICRTELLSTQEKAGKQLSNLMNLNPQAKALRAAMAQAQAQLAYATITANYTLAAKATAEIARIRKLQTQLDRLQKSLIALATQEMNKGLLQVSRQLKVQSQTLQSRLPDFIRFQIHTIQTFPQTLAVQPDKPDLAPVYELQKEFKERQALSVSWISEFRSDSAKRSPWILNRHQKKDFCHVTLEEKKSRYEPVLKADRSFLKL